MGLQFSKKLLGSGWGSVGRVVVSDTRGPWFKSSHQRNFSNEHIYCWKKRKQRKERPGMAQLKNIGKYFCSGNILLFVILYKKVIWTRSQLATNFIQFYLMLLGTTMRKNNSKYFPKINQKYENLSRIWNILQANYVTFKAKKKIRKIKCVGALLVWWLW